MKKTLFILTMIFTFLSFSAFSEEDEVKNETETDTETVEPVKETKPKKAKREMSFESVNAFGIQGSMIVGYGFPHPIKSQEVLLDTGDVISNDFGLCLDFFRRRYWTDHFGTSFRFGLETMYFPMTCKMFNASFQLWKMAGDCFAAVPVFGAIGGIFMGCCAAVVDICIPIVWLATSDIEFNIEYLPYRNQHLDTVLSGGVMMFHFRPGAQFRCGIAVKASHFLLTTNVGYRMYFANLIDMDNFDYARDGHTFVADLGIRFAI